MLYVPSHILKGEGKVARQGLLGGEREKQKRDTIDRLRSMSVTSAHTSKECENIRRAITSLASEVNQRGEGPRVRV